MNRLILVVMIFALSACATVPEQIQVEEGQQLIPFSILADNPKDEALLGKPARWAGKIVGVQNKEKVSEIEVVAFPASENGRPLVGEESRGRFKAVVEGFVDPLVFEAERLITIVGDIAPAQSGIIGEQAYLYPTIDAAGYFMWKDTSDIELRNIGYSPFYFGPAFHARRWSIWHHGFRGGFYDPWLGLGYSGIHHNRFRVINRNGHSQGGRAERPNRPSNNSTRNQPRRSSSGATGRAAPSTVPKVQQK